MHSELRLLDDLAALQFLQATSSSMDAQFIPDAYF